MSFWIPVALMSAWAVTIAARLGVFQRITLALGPVSLELIPGRAARHHGDRILFTTDTPCSWDVPALRDRYPHPHEWSANRIRTTAGYLISVLHHELAIKRGDRVAVMKANHLDIHIFNTAIVLAGGVACPMNGRFPADKVDPYLKNIGAEVLISDVCTVLRVLEEGGSFGTVTHMLLCGRQSSALCDDAVRFTVLLGAYHPAIRIVWIESALATASFEGRVVRRDREEPLYLVHSSGTTGFPKAVILRNGAQSHAVRGWLSYVHVSRTRDKGYFAVPNNHQAIILSFNSALLLGLRVHWAAACGREGLDAEQVVSTLARDGFTGFFAFPIVYTQLMEVDLAAHDLGKMRFWASTADASHEVVQRRFVATGNAFRELGLPLSGSIFLDAQGSSEVGTPSVVRYVTARTRAFARRIGRPGSTPFGPSIRVRKHTGELAAAGEVGRLEVQGRTVFNAYWNDHSLTRQAFHGDWFFTGDVARYADDGNLVQLDREADVIHTSSGDVYSLPIEEKIHHHPAVFDACVYGARQSDGTQQPAAAIALRAGFDLTDATLTHALNNMLLPAEQLCRVNIIPWKEFPIGITGKTLKRVLAARTEPCMPAERNRPPERAMPKTNRAANWTPATLVAS